MLISIFIKILFIRKIDPYNYESIKEAFILDAKRNGLDISYIRNETLIIDVVDWNYGQAYAATCQTGKIKLSWEDNYDVLHDPQGQERYLKTMWHELGHGVLNLKHNSINTDIMYSSPRGNGSIIYDLDEFRESSRRMFQNIGQIPYDCGFAVKNYNTLLIDAYKALNWHRRGVMQTLSGNNRVEIQYLSH